MALPRVTLIKAAAAQPSLRHADFEGMARWRAFVDVLDDMLSDRSETVAEIASRTAARHAGTQPIYGNVSTLGNRFWTAQGPYRQGPAPLAREAAGAAAFADAINAHFTQAERTARPTPSATPTAEPRTVRLLKPSERHALQTLVTLGAPLDASFTTRELRTAFRSLAHRYHPDRHPHVSDAERTRLGATFAKLTSAYGVLSDATAR